jgi:hypothetical protein
MNGIIAVETNSEWDVIPTVAIMSCDKTYNPETIILFQYCNWL